MIRRNVAGQVIYLPQLTTVDGVAITSAASITVAKDGVEDSSAGTLSHFSNGVWKYTPTQGETDAAIVGLVLTATNGLPVVLNLITTAANTAAVALGANTTTPPTASANADATLSSLKTGPSTGGNWPVDSFGRGLLIGSQPQREVLVAGNGHVASTIHSVQTDAITGDGIAASGITKIAAGVWSALISGFNVVGSAGEVLKALASMLEFVSGAWRWVANSLSQAPTGGGGDGIYARTFAVSSPSGAVSGVAISVVGTAIRVVTGTDGSAVVNLDAGTYTIRFGVPPGFAQQADITLAVSASGSTSVSLTPVSVPAPPSANSCLLSVYVRNQSTEPADGITVTARLPKGWDVQGNTFNLNEIVSDVTDSTGLAQLYLMRSTKYELSFSRANGTIAKIPIETPDAATANLSQVYTG